MPEINLKCSLLKKNKYPCRITAEIGVYEIHNRLRYFLLIDLFWDCSLFRKFESNQEFANTKLETVLRNI